MNSISISFRLVSVVLFSFIIITIDAQKVHTSYLWHMDQPVYWADKSQDKTDSKQFVEESHRLKMNGQNRYPGSTKAHPTNDLEEIFSKADRVQAYQSSPRNAVNSIRDLPNAGAQLSISAGLMENLQSLGAKNQWGYSATWMNPYKEAIAWKTTGNFPRLDVVSFTYDHALSPLVSERTLKKQILAHQYVSGKYYGHISRGYWPAECAFSERIIKTLVECNVEWSVIANSHLARTLSDYEHPYNINGNVDAPNRADRVPTAGQNWFDATIDGRGNRLAAPYCYQAHKAQYIDPATGTPYKIDVVPMCNYISYVDGYSGANTGDIATKIAPYSNETHPSIVLLAHDGDNAWGGGSSYYNEAVTSFTHAAANAGYAPTTIQQFLNDNPVPASDIVRVEDGAWVNAESDWGHPQFINWLWPLYSKTDYRFDPDGWTEDARNWAVITATENYVTMAEDLEGGNLRIDKIADGGSAATNAEKAWHFYFGGLNSGFMYYGKAEDMEVKPSLTGNIAIDYAQRVIQANAGTDQTAPSVFIPQRFPYNPGATGFGPTTGYKKVNYSSDFHVWTYAFDVSGLSSVKLKYRTDKDGLNPIESIQNDTYAGGDEVSAWSEIEMTRRAMKADPTDDPELNFFIQPAAKAELCYAEITALKDTLVDYYVEAIDSKGNIFQTPIQHVYIESGDGNNGGSTNPDVSWTPEKPASNENIIISCKNATAASRLHWAINTWTSPISAYQPTGTVAATGGAVQTPFNNVDGVWQVVLGPFNNPEQAVTEINFVIKHESSWDNNGGNDYKITVSPAQTDNPSSQNIQKSIFENQSYTFTTEDFTFSSPLSNAFGHLKVKRLPTNGQLKYNSVNVTIDAAITDPTLLTYTSGSTSDSFTFKVVDDKGNESDAIYTATFNVTDPNANPITVSFLKPTDWGNAAVNIWAWNSSGDIFEVWPGPNMQITSANWYSYTFDAAIENINVIFSKNGNPQTVDIMNITKNTCYETTGISANKITVKETDCYSAIKNVESKHSILLYPQPAGDYIWIESKSPEILQGSTIYISDMNGQTLLTKVMSENTIMIGQTGIPSGIYILKIVSGKGEIISTNKLALQ
ncbi:MAG: starch-binding protein [Paludibacteraceae bacterium]|nr:starch-binding protein [Paludibacteraceae bacterium]